MPLEFLNRCGWAGPGQHPWRHTLLVNKAALGNEFPATSGPHMCQGYLLTPYKVLSSLHRSIPSTPPFLDLKEILKFTKSPRLDAFSFLPQNSQEGFCKLLPNFVREKCMFFSSRGLLLPIIHFTIRFAASLAAISCLFLICTLTRYRFVEGFCLEG